MIKDTHSPTRFGLCLTRRCSTGRMHLYGIPSYTALRPLNSTSCTELALSPCPEPVCGTTLLDNMNAPRLMQVNFSW